MRAIKFQEIAVLFFCFLCSFPALSQAIDERFLGANIFKTADADGNGVVTSAEGDEFMKKTFEVIDSNKDGLAGQVEFFAYYKSYLKPSPPPAGAQMLFKMDLQTKDADHDGVISLAEFQEHARKMFKVQDVNGDGLLQPSEIAGQAQ